MAALIGSTTGFPAVLPLEEQPPPGEQLLSRQDASAITRDWDGEQPAEPELQVRRKAHHPR